VLEDELFFEESDEELEESDEELEESEVFFEEESPLEDELFDEESSDADFDRSAEDAFDSLRA